jgi:hypothetical protein
MQTSALLLFAQRFRYHMDSVSAGNERKKTESYSSRNVSENRTKIDLNLLVRRSCTVSADDHHRLFVIQFCCVHHDEPLCWTNIIYHSGAVNSDIEQLYSITTTAI